VAQWRIQPVTGREKIKLLSAEEQALLGNTPEDGGLELDKRVVPRHF